MSAIDTLTDSQLRRVEVTLSQTLRRLQDLLCFVGPASPDVAEDFHNHVVGEITRIVVWAELAQDYLSGKLPYKPV